MSSVARQTVLPAEWIIVSDGSTDRTDDLVLLAAEKHSWIRLLSLAPRSDRSFAAVVHAIEAGYRARLAQDYAYIGLLDADVRFQEDYFERLLAAFESALRLGLAGGLVVDLGRPRDFLPRNRQDVPGAVQFFRRSCFEDLGPLLAIPEGGWDAMTCARARMCGHETRLLTDLVVDHLKPRNSFKKGVFGRHWQLGVRDYVLGYSLLIEGLKCLDRMTEAPVVVGSVARALGFGWSWLRRRPVSVPADLLRFSRAEHLSRLCESLRLRRNSVRPAPHTSSAVASPHRL